MHIIGGPCERVPGKWDTAY